MTKKVVSITLLLIGLAFAVAGQTAEYTYTTNNGGITITGYTGVNAGRKVRRVAVENRSTCLLFTPPSDGCQFLL